MRWSSPDALRKSRKASAVVAKPPGTRTPALDSWLIISPSDAFLPPTESTSVMRSCSNETTYDIEVTFYNGEKASLVNASGRSEEHTSELQSLMRISYAVFCLKKKNRKQQRTEL